MSRPTAVEPTLRPPRPPPPARGAPRSRYLAQSIILEEGGPAPFLRVAVLFAALIVAGFVTWAAVTEIDELAISPGEVIPTGAVQQVQHLEGGIVASILVAEGDIVRPGQALVRLDEAATLAELDRMRARSTVLELQAERLRAFADARGARLAASDSRYAGIAADQRAILSMQDEERRRQAEVLEIRIAQRQAELAALDDQERVLEQQVALLEELFGMRDALLKKGLMSRIVYLETKRELSRERGRLDEVVNQRRSARIAIAEIRGQLKELDSRLRREALDEMGRATAELAPLREAIAGLQHRLQRLEITSPVRGVVLELKVNTVGGVIAPGATVVAIVPLDRELVVEVRISPANIGHVRPGQPVAVKVATYDFARYGAIDGRLERISATTFEDEEGRPYYKGRVALDRPYLGDQPDRNLVLPGMTVTADINTGRKTLLAYLVKPVYTALDRGFRER